jgi:alanyl-tRNA synthetase
MTANELRKCFLSYFEEKKHKIVPSAPMVVKDDPTLMFTNAGMNQFKDLFLGNSPIVNKRIADSQKCLRVSGKHNDLEEVGHDTYHHTMFEMLGNWSFGDYFKEEAIAWAWDFLTEILKIEKERLYVTIFEGDETEMLAPDNEAKKIWEKHIDKNQILNGSKKDNFWEMGEQGPCGPCSEIHVDIRSDKERKEKDGKELVNRDHPLVIEIWNLVFIQYNRKANGKLEKLSQQHVDTGMGFERLCMVVQGKKSNYDTDIFQSIIQSIASLSGKKYQEKGDTGIAMRVIADHLRAVCFAIADGQIPSNNKAGYVIRRILRRAIRYAFTYLGQKEPFIHKLVPVLVQEMGNAYPELNAQKAIITKVIEEEEATFLKTLATGIRLLDQRIQDLKRTNKAKLPGTVAFELYDTYGFPLDLTGLILKENLLSTDEDAFHEEMEKQKSRSRNAALVETEDWHVIQTYQETSFVGYDQTEAPVRITQYRKITQKNKTFYQLVFDQTPFYPEGGGQVGDSGTISSGNEKIQILNTVRENQAILHISPALPKDINASFSASVDKEKRSQTQMNHSATHLLHHVLRNTLGEHVEQKGSLVAPDRLRFDFSHFQKLSDEELQNINLLVNALIRKNTPIDEKRDCSPSEAQKMGALALFGEKYGDKVRVIKFNDSIELCGGTHVGYTGEIGTFVITSESAIAAGIRRIEACTGERAIKLLLKKEQSLQTINHILKTQKSTEDAVSDLLAENSLLKKELEKQQKVRAGARKNEIKESLRETKGVLFGAIILDNIKDNNELKEISAQLRGESQNLFLVLGAEINGKAHLSIAISEELTKHNDYHAGKLIKTLAKHIRGGGGGQAFYAMAGGTNPKGLPAAMEEAKNIIAYI